ncbi:MAG: hypothetical protein KC593_19255 [Myxococcales bacterium]|nr:hypothetical protein [Myxococcales bacterium]
MKALLPSRVALARVAAATAALFAFGAVWSRVGSAYLGQRPPVDHALGLGVLGHGLPWLSTLMVMVLALVALATRRAPAVAGVIVVAGLALASSLEATLAPGASVDTNLAACGGLLLAYALGFATRSGATQRERERAALDAACGVAAAISVLSLVTLAQELRGSGALDAGAVARLVARVAGVSLLVPRARVVGATLVGLTYGLETALGLADLGPTALAHVALALAWSAIGGARAPDASA